MTFAQAAKIQYLHSSYYVVFLVGPNGERIRLGSTQRKSGSGLLSILREKAVQALIVDTFIDAESVRITKKTAVSLLFDNGWSMQFGGTIREEASAS